MVAFLIAAAVGALFYFFVWTPQTNRRAELTSTLQTQVAEVARLRRLAETREEKEREFQALSDRIRLVELKLPPEREIPNLIRQLQTVAQDLGVKMNLLRPGQTQAGPAGAPAAAPAAPARPGVPVAPGQPARPAVPGQQPAAPAQPRYNLFRLDLAFDGSFPGLMAFLGRLEDFPRFIVIKQVSLAPGELPRLRATINAETFILPKESTPTP
jgi:hypothetical protein